MAVGFNSTTDITVPAALDLDLLRNEQLASGMTVADVVTDFFAALNLYNGEVAGGQGKIGTILSLLTAPTSDREVRKQLGDHSRGTNVEYVEADPQKGDKTAWMIGDTTVEQRIGGTWQYLREAPAEDITANIGRMFDATRDALRYELLVRLFTSAEIAVGAGYSRGVMGGTATNTTPAYYPPRYMGQTFDSTHSHLTRNTLDATGLRAVLREGWTDLREHGHAPSASAPHILLHSPSQMDLVQADSQYQEAAESQLFKVWGDSAYTRLGDLSAIGHGLIQDTNAVCVEMYGIPSGYAALIQTYGANNARNPLRRWYSPLDGDRAIPLGVEPGQSARQTLTSLGLYKRFGFGWYDPVGAFLIKLSASGDYTDPTVT